MRWTILLLVAVCTAAEDLHLTTDDAGYLTVIQGFATQLQCVLNTCSDKVIWYKDDILLFNGTKFQKESHLDESSFVLNHQIDIDASKGCMGECQSNSDCESGHSCIDSQCCACAKEDFSLILRNLTFEDSGRYRCQIANQSELLEFQVEVLESGLKGGFHENISYDHSQCCQEKGISSMCRAMCKPSDMGTFHFDPTSCKTDDYKNFLSCATDGGNRSHVHCCKTQMVPSFCYDFCSGDFQMLRRSHRLCLYYLPEIFECYNRAYLPYPDAPVDVIVNAVDHDKLTVCWKPPPVQPSNKDYPVRNYSVFYKQIPSFPFFPGVDGLGSDLPFLGGGDYGDLTEMIDDEYEEPLRVTPTTASTPPRRRRSFELQEREVEVNGERLKRQTWVLVTRDESTNTSSVREFNFEQVNTTETCVTLKDLRGATRYAVYVIATNDYGESVPSLRSITSTNVHVLSSNDSAPDSMQCCRDANVNDYCLGHMCDATKQVSLFSTISISTSCRHEWPKVSPCIADGRNHTECCRRRGVQKECLPICSGSTEELSAHSMLCLNLDLSAIFQCLREGYETHPSAPQNVTVDRITTTSAAVTWAEPASNAHLVQNYTVFIRRNTHGSPVRMIESATSPYVVEELLPDASYAVSVQSHSERGTSLPSTTLLFQTKAPNSDICPFGEPLLLNDGRPMLCDEKHNSCPLGFSCFEVLDDAYCCPNQAESSNNFYSCCEERGLKDDCLSSCRYNATSLPEKCTEHLNTWVQCGSEGHDHTRCCEQSDIPHECQTACRHPFQIPDSCVSSVDRLLYCFSSHHSRLPGLVKNPHITFLSRNEATLEWDSAANTDIYEVQLFNLREDSLVNRTNTTKTSMPLSELAPSVEYSARVLAFNSAGSSPPSWNISFETLPEHDFTVESPQAPRGLKIVWNHGIRANFTWDPVVSSRDGAALGGKPVYIVSYVAADNKHQWATKETNNTWVVLGDLLEDEKYLIFVTAKYELKTSRSSSVITILAQPDSLGLPEPTIKIMPDRHLYSIGEKISIECSLDEANATSLSIDLTANGQTFHNDKGMHFAVGEVKTTHDMDTISCAAADKDGRQNVQMRNILVKFGPIASMDRGIAHAFDDLSAEISCTVSGFPIPAVHFEREGHLVGHDDGESFKMRSPAAHTIEYTLVLRNATGMGGHYACVAESDGVESRSVAELITEKTSELPANPRKVLDCCEEKGVQGDCLQACSLGKVPGNLTCREHAHALISCAEDIRDHSDCCAARGVRGRCLALCAGDSISNDLDCAEHAVAIVSCSVRGHESSPQRPLNLKYSVTEQGKIKVTWDDPSASKNNYVFYAVYYKKKETDDDYRVKKTTSRSVELDVENAAAYEVFVVAGNAFGLSPQAYLQVDDTTYEKGSTGGRSFIFIILLLVICSVVALGVMLLGRRKALPSFFGSKPLSGNDPTVAFENPGFNSEVEIRGLGTGSGRDADWQSHELQATTDSEYRNGMRYSKLEG